MTPEQAAFVHRVLTVFAENDLCGSLYWRTDGEYAPVTFFVNCNDVFCWGCADGEDVTPANLGVLEQAIADCEAIDAVVGSCYAVDLFASRVRGMRPQGCCYPDDRRFWPLLDAAGPVREVGIGNPYTPESYRAKRHAEKQKTT